MNPTLRFAAMHGVVAAIRLHIERHDPLNERDANGETALMIAARRNHREACAMLIEAGADPGLLDSKGLTAANHAEKAGALDAFGLLSELLRPCTNTQRVAGPNPRLDSSEPVGSDAQLPVEGQEQQSREPELEQVRSDDWEPVVVSEPPKDDVELHVLSRQAQEVMGSHVPLDSSAVSWVDISVYLPERVEESTLSAMTKTRHAPPRASAMLESMRGLGYTTGSALADIVDNSISAGASTVDIQFSWAGPDSWISVLDDGHGMADAELESAMRLGDKSPLVERDAGDLGRFGMGLKTASLSQCRRLTVASVKSGSESCLRWDLDALAEGSDWLLFEGPATGSEPLLAGLRKQDNGAIVLWEKLDRVVTAGFVLDDFNQLIDRVESHLAMVFHRLLEGPTPAFVMKINGRLVRPWDPFLSGHPAKAWASPVARSETKAGVVMVECHVLPYKDKLTAKEFELAGGPEGWNAQQGFYVYRNRRLLVAGGWLGLGAGKGWTREESLRLARIRLDIPNTADADWKIDIRKSMARPPVALRPWLARLAEETRERARRVFVHRGSPGALPGEKPVEQAWKTEHLKSGVRYRIDVNHPAISSVLDCAGEQLPAIKAMLSVIEATVPVQKIWLDTTEHKEPPKNRYEGVSSDEVREVVRTLFEDMVVRRQMSEESAKRMLLSTDPFQNFSEIVNGLQASDFLKI